MKLPTREELEEAVRGFDEDGPLPMGACCDRSPSITAWIREVVKSTGMDEQQVKVGLVFGLNLGIRIGESRSKK